MKHLDLFSGIGGFALAARWVGIETVQFVEIEPFAQKVLNKNFPNIPIHDDIKTFKADEFSGIGIITGGYPCQPFSQAGKRRGEEDDRHLWPAMFEIIRSCRPDWVLAENVAGHVSMGLDEVLSDLESEDYTCQPLIVPACAVDAPHRRDRVWIVADSTGKRPYRLQPKERVFQKKNQNSSKFSHCYRSNGGKNEGRILWENNTTICRVGDGIPSRVDRLRGLGNAIVPQVAYEIINAMIEAEYGRMTIREYLQTVKRKYAKAD